MKAEVHNLCTNVYCVIISLLNSKKLQSAQTKIVELRSEGIAIVRRKIQMEILVCVYIHVFFLTQQ